MYLCMLTIAKIKEIKKKITRQFTSNNLTTLGWSTFFKMAISLLRFSKGSLFPLSTGFTIKIKTKTRLEIYNH